MCERGHKAVCHKTRLQVISKRRAANDCLSFDFEEEMWKIDRFKPANFPFILSCFFLPLDCSEDSLQRHALLSGRKQHEVYRVLQAKRRS